MGIDLQINKTDLEGVYLVEPFHAHDKRGSFYKYVDEGSFREIGLVNSFREQFYSESGEGVIRGMHYQEPPEPLTKLVYVVSGAIIDVVLDIRKASPTYGSFIDYELSYDNKRALYIPPGFAHGFLVLGDHARVMYLQNGVYSMIHDAGIHWDSFGMDWGVVNPVISERDERLPAFGDFATPF